MEKKKVCQVVSIYIFVNKEGYYVWTKPVPQQNGHFVMIFSTTGFDRWIK